MIVEIVVQRNILVIALDQAAAGRVVARGRQRQAGVFAQSGNGLNEALSEALLANHQAAVMILNRAGHDFRSGGGTAVDDHHQRHGDAAIAAHGVVAALGRSAPVMGNDQLILVEEHVGNGHGFIQQAARISAQVENDAVELGGVQIFQRRGQFGIGGLVKSGKLDVADAGLDFKIEVDGMLGNFVARHGEAEIFGVAHALHRNVNDRALGALQHVGDFGTAQSLRGFSVHGHDHVARPNAGAVRRRARHGREHVRVSYRAGRSSCPRRNIFRAGLREGWRRRADRKSWSAGQERATFPGSRRNKWHDRYRRESRNLFGRSTGHA